MPSYRLEPPQVNHHKSRRVQFSTRTLIGALIAVAIYLATIRRFGIVTPANLIIGIAIGVILAKSKRVPAIAAGLGGAIGGTIALVLPRLILDVYHNEDGGWPYFDWQYYNYWAFNGAWAGFIAGACYGIYRRQRMRQWTGLTKPWPLLFMGIYALWFCFFSARVRSDTTVMAATFSAAISFLPLAFVSSLLYVRIQRSRTADTRMFAKSDLRASRHESEMGSPNRASDKVLAWSYFWQDLRAGIAFIHFLAGTFFLVISVGYVKQQFPKAPHR